MIPTPCPHPTAWVVKTRLGGTVCLACGEDNPVADVHARRAARADKGE